MKFSIQEEGGEKQIFFTFKEASEKTGLTSKNIARVLKSGRNKYFRRCDKKTFWIQNEETTPLYRSMEKIFSLWNKFRRDLEFLEQFFSINFAKNETHFLDSQEKSHEVTWSSPCLEKFIDLVKKAKMGENIYQKTQGLGVGKRNTFLKGQEDVKSAMENCQNAF